MCKKCEFYDDWCEQEKMGCEGCGHYKKIKETEEVKENTKEEK